MRAPTILFSLFSFRLKKAGSTALAGLLILPFSSCHDMARVDTKGIKKEMEARTVYHINDNQLAQGAQAVGDRITHRLDSALATEANSQKPCRDGWNDILAQLARPYTIQVVAVPFDSISTFKASAKEREVLDALAYTHQQGQPAPSNIQKLEDKSYQYVRAITPPNAQSLNCLPVGFRSLSWQAGAEVGIYHLRIPTRPAALEASKGLKGMK